MFKKIIILIFFFIGFSFANQLSVSGDFAQADTLLTYRYGVETTLEDTSYFIYSKYYGSSIEGKHYTLINTNLIYRQKYWQTGLEYLLTEKSDVEFIKLDLRARYNGWSLGTCEIWNWHPETKIVLGKELKKEFNFFIFPVIFNFKSDVFYPDFVNTTKLDLDLELNTGVINNILQVIDKKRIPQLSLGVGFDSYYEKKLDYISMINFKIKW